MSAQIVLWNVPEVEKSILCVEVVQYFVHHTRGFDIMGATIDLSIFHSVVNEIFLQGVAVPILAHPWIRIHLGMFSLPSRSVRLLSYSSSRMEWPVTFPYIVSALSFRKLVVCYFVAGSAYFCRTL